MLKYLPKQLLSKPFLPILLVVYTVLITLLAGPLVKSVFATNDFTVSNLTFDPATGKLQFDYTGSSLQSSNPDMQVYDTTGTTSYWVVTGGGSANCTSSHCRLVIQPVNSDTGVTSVIIKTAGGLESQTLNYPFPLPTSFTPQNPSGSGGWTAPGETWTYASSSSFTVSGVDRTAVYRPGTKVQFTNNGSTKYGYVKSASYSANTTVDLVANTDYSINNSAITNTFYSYEDNPQGFPAVLHLSLSGVTGFSTIDGYLYTMQISGRRVFLMFNIEGQSNASTLTIPTPIPTLLMSLGQYAFDQFPVAVVVSNGGLQSSPGVMGFNTSTQELSTLYVGKTFNSSSGNTYGGFSTSGAKGVYGQYSYPF